MLKIHVQSLKEDPEEFSTVIRKAEADLGSDIQLVEDIKVTLQIHRIGEKVVIRGMVRTRVGLKCSRCLVDFENSIEVAMFIFALPAMQLDAIEGEERELEASDPAIIHYAGEQIDLLPEVQSTLILAVPMKPLCSEACPGLCTHCGRKLEAGRCICSDEISDGPFSVLKNFKK